jgi:hypothetical protein
MHSNIKKYVYYDKNGNITAIRNSNTSSDNIPCLEVDLDQVIDLVTGAKPFSNYCIMFDTISKKNQLTIKTVDEINNYDANRSIYKIQKSSNADVTIIKNCKEKCWSIKFHDQIDINLLSIASLSFSITKENDPHELYRVFQINLNSLEDYKIPMICDEELLENSVYTLKRFDSYSIEIIQ